MLSLFCSTLASGSFNHQNVMLSAKGAKTYVQAHNPAYTHFWSLYITTLDSYYLLGLKRTVNIVNIGTMIMPKTTFHVQYFSTTFWLIDLFLELKTENIIHRITCPSDNIYFRYGPRCQHIRHKNTENKNTDILSDKIHKRKKQITKSYEKNKIHIQ